MVKMTEVGKLGQVSTGVAKQPGTPLGLGCIHTPLQTVYLAVAVSCSSLNKPVLFHFSMQTCSEQFL